MRRSFLRRFGERLKRLRQHKQFSQEKLADAASLDRTYISLLERGMRNPSLECLAAIASALDITISELCDFKHLDSKDA